MFKGYTEAGFHTQTLHLFRRMRTQDVKPNDYTFPFVLKACSAISETRAAMAVHCFGIKAGFQFSHFFAIPLLDMYSAAGWVESARSVFGEMPCRNVVAWTAIIKACLSVGDVDGARELFDRVVDRDVILWNTMVAGYVEDGDLVAARELFDEMPNKDVMAWNTMLLGYASNGETAECEKIFEDMLERNVFSWNGLMAGYARHDRFSDVLNVFDRMLGLGEIEPNDATLVAVLSACSKLGSLGWGRLVHSYAQRNGFNGSVYVCNGLIDMYSKCGAVEEAVKVFERMEGRDVITWNSMIGGLASNGHCLEAMELFDRMMAGGERPDGITFVAILSACAHVGLVDRGLMLFQSMKEHGVEHWIEHYGCVVGLLGRAGLVKEAVGFIRRMPVRPDRVIWSTLLSVCQVRIGRVGLAEIAVSRLVRSGLDEEAAEDWAADWVALARVYWENGRWEDAERVRKVVRRMRVGDTRLPGCSWVEVGGESGLEVVEFCSSDVRHWRTGEIYEVVVELAEMARLADG